MFIDLGDEANSVIDSSTLPLAFTTGEVVADAATGRGTTGLGTSASK
jgi:hypothetical protein